MDKIDSNTFLDETIKQLNSDTEKGLSEKECEERLEKYGKNKLKEQIHVRHIYMTVLLHDNIHHIYSMFFLYLQ